MLITERYAAGRTQNSLVTGLARHGAEVWTATLTGALARAGRLLAALEEAVAGRSRDSWHLHADETTWHVLAPGRETAPRSGGCGCLPARTPSASSWIRPRRSRSGPARRHR
jgi:transposase